MFSVSNLVLLANVLSLKRLLRIILSGKKEGLEEAWWNYKSIDLNSFKILPSVIILQHQQVKGKLPLNFCLAQNQKRFFLKPPTYKHCLIKPLKSLDPNVPFCTLTISQDILLCWTSLVIILSILLSVIMVLNAAFDCLNRILASMPISISSVLCPIFMSGSSSRFRPLSTCCIFSSFGVILPQACH